MLTCQPEISCAVANRAFTPDHPPRLEVDTSGIDIAGPLTASVFDLLTNTDHPLPGAAVHAADRGRLIIRPRLPYGVYRLRVADDAAKLTDTCFAYAPAARPEELPDDWPIASHVTERHPEPLPGFKWYRYFSHWSRNNPAPNEYDWSRLDQVYGCVKAAGGKLEIADDGAPVWATRRGKAQMDWMPEATAYPPDDWRHLRDYLDRLIARYDDGSGTLGSLEVWNEANTYQRFLGEPQDLVEMARLYKAAAAKASTPIEVVGIALSAGNHPKFVEDLVDAGILQHLDAISGHFYEEMHACDAGAPINSLPLHASILREPMRRAGYDLPIYNSECGIAAVPRENGRIVPQDELNRRAEAHPDLDRKRPWIIGDEWRSVSEYRGAAEFVAGIVMLMAEGVSRTYTYLNYDWIIEEAASLYWVATSVLGQHLRHVDYQLVRRVESATDTPGREARAYRIGADNGPSVTVAWTHQPDIGVGMAKLWQPWLTPCLTRVRVEGDTATLTDLYGRRSRTVETHDGWVSVEVGEEPVYLTPAR